MRYDLCMVDRPIFVSETVTFEEYQARRERRNIELQQLRTAKAKITRPEACEYKSHHLRAPMKSRLHNLRLALRLLALAFSPFRHPYTGDQ